MKPTVYVLSAITNEYYVAEDEFDFQEPFLAVGKDEYDEIDRLYKMGVELNLTKLDQMTKMAGEIERLKGIIFDLTGEKEDD